MDFDVYKYMIKNKLQSASALGDKEFRDFFKDIKIKTVVEIGTHKGISAAYMAGFAKTIFTFDIEDFPEKYKVWEDLQIKDRIHFYLIKNSKGIRQVLNKILFDFAFIDDSHEYDDVKKHFELVKHCGKVLFHDVNKKVFPGVKKFAEEIGVEIIGNIAYWEK